MWHRSAPKTREPTSADRDLVDAAIAYHREALVLAQPSVLWEGFSLVEVAVAVARIEARQAALLTAFDQQTGASRQTLDLLAAHGVDIVPVLGVLVLMDEKWARGTDPPMPHRVTLRFRAREIWFWLKDSGAAMARWTATGKLQGSGLRRHQTGPAEIQVSFTMALLAKELRRKRVRHYYDVIAKLVRVWAPWIRGSGYLNGEHVRVRVRGVVAEHPKVWHAKVEWFSGYGRAHATAFELLRIHRTDPPPYRES